MDTNPTTPTLGPRLKGVINQLYPNQKPPISWVHFVLEYEGADTDRQTGK